MGSVFALLGHVLEIEFQEAPRVAFYRFWDDFGRLFDGISETVSGLLDLVVFVTLLMPNLCF